MGISVSASTDNTLHPFFFRTVDPGTVDFLCTVVVGPAVLNLEGLVSKAVE